MLDFNYIMLLAIKPSAVDKNEANRIKINVRATLNSAVVEKFTYRMKL
jgi:hypothetical protein